MRFRVEGREWWEGTCAAEGLLGLRVFVVELVASLRRPGSAVKRVDNGDLVLIQLQTCCSR